MEIVFSLTKCDVEIISFLTTYEEISEQYLQPLTRGVKDPSCIIQNVTEVDNPRTLEKNLGSAYIP